MYSKPFPTGDGFFLYYDSLPGIVVESPQHRNSKMLKAAKRPQEALAGL